MAMAVGRHWAYYVESLTITLVLALAANTSFGGLPILASLLARDNYLPHAFAQRGDRQVFFHGIWVLAGFSAVLLIAVSGNTNTLIPLFAIGVFTGFTLSQSGLVVHWRRRRPPGWQRRAIHQRDRRRDHRRRHPGVPFHQVHRGGVGGGGRRPALHPPLSAGPRLLPASRPDPRARADPAPTRGQAHAGHRAGHRRLPPHRAGAGGRPCPSGRR